MPPLLQVFIMAPEQLVMLPLVQSFISPLQPLWPGSPEQFKGEDLAVFESLQIVVGEVGSVVNPQNVEVGDTGLSILFEAPHIA